MTTPRSKRKKVPRDREPWPEAHLEMTNVITLRKGRIIYQEFFWDHAEALEAAGLSE
jgi:hypothetical protein